MLLHWGTEATAIWRACIRWNEQGIRDVQHAINAANRNPRRREAFEAMADYARIIARLKRNIATLEARIAMTEDKGYV